MEIDEQSWIGERFIDETWAEQAKSWTLRPAHSCVAHEHGQHPFAVGFIEAKDVQAPVIAPNLDVAVVRSIPLIERFENVDLMPA